MRQRLKQMTLTIKIKTMKRYKIGQGYYRHGYGRGFISAPIIYYIDGKAYARHKAGYDEMFPDYQQYTIPGYVPVMRSKLSGNFFQVDKPCKYE